jgi:hypothetical protein
MQDQATAITMTAACEMGRHGSCRGVVLSLTDAHGQPCSCPCHNGGRSIAADLPATFAELVFTYPPCGEDTDLAPIDDDDPDGEDVNEAAIELAIERRLELEHFGDYGYDDDGGRWS